MNQLISSNFNDESEMVFTINNIMPAKGLLHKTRVLKSFILFFPVHCWYCRLKKQANFNIMTKCCQAYLRNINVSWDRFFYRASEMILNERLIILQNLYKEHINTFRQALWFYLLNNLLQTYINDMRSEKTHPVGMQHSKSTS